MNMRAKHQLTLAVLPRYCQANRLEKGRILDEYCANTGFHRKYAIQKLQRYRTVAPASLLTPGRHRKRRPRIYDGPVRAALPVIWEAADYRSSKLLHPYLPELVRVLEAHGELNINDEVRWKLLAMSHGTLAALLTALHVERIKHLHGTTKPGSLLKSQIPLRVGLWDETRPGFLEIDLVAHCGDTVAGEFAYTLDCTDIATAWVERRAVLGRGQERVHQALQDIRRTLPFSLLGIDSDNDSAFINDQLWRWCRHERIAFTRSRPYQKNDNAHIEQKNWTCVRKVFGYQRIDAPEQVALMNALYQGPLRLYTNCFQPVLQCVGKQRIGSRVKRQYDRARTPYQRVSESPTVPDGTKTALRSQYATLNPLTLRREITVTLSRISSLRRQQIAAVVALKQPLTFRHIPCTAR